MYFPEKPLSYLCIRREFYWFDLPHKVPMMVTVAIVVAKDTPVVAGESSQIDVGKTVANDVSILKTRLFFQQCPFSLAFEPILLKLDLSNGLLSMCHRYSITQVGCLQS